MPFDKQSQQAVLAELDWGPSVVTGHIGVIANAWVVTLTGHFECVAEKYAAETAPPRVDDVSNQLLVKPAVDVSDISDKIRRGLRRSWLLDDGPVTVRADDGCVRLTGTVRSPHDRQVAWATALDA